ncbi:TPA: BspA family leucine-rich repeat surface protein, partial [Enterococcus faecalis]
MKKKVISLALIGIVGSSLGTIPTVFAETKSPKHSQSQPEDSSTISEYHLENILNSSVLNDIPLTAEEAMTSETEEKTSINETSDSSTLEDLETQTSTAKVSSADLENKETKEKVNSSEDTIVESGSIGTSKWTLDSDGLLTIEAGTFNDSPSFDSINTRAVKTVIFTGVVKAGSSLQNLFRNMTYLISIENLHYLETSNVTNMDSMFYSCDSLTSLDLSNFNTSNVTTMDSMFYSCSSLTSLDVSNFNTSNVTNMDSMFYSCSSLTSLDVSNFNTSNVTIMFGMFSFCSSLTSLDVSNFNTSNVTNMDSMFYSCSSLTSLDVSNFNTSNVTNMEVMFSSCSSLTSLDVSNFNTSNVTNMGAMFRYSDSLTSLDVSNFNTSNVTNMYDMFSLVLLNEITLGKKSIFDDTVNLPAVSKDITFTGKWEGVNSKKVYESSESFMDEYNGETPDTYVWQKYDAAPLTVKYVDIEGNEIHEAQTITGKVGNDYDATTSDYKLTIDGYVLDESQLPENATGTLSNKAQTVVYVYN